MKLLTKLLVNAVMEIEKKEKRFTNKQSRYLRENTKAKQKEQQGQQNQQEKEQEDEGGFLDNVFDSLKGRGRGLF